MSSQDAADGLASVKQLLSLQDKSYIVTGGGGGIGFAIIRTLMDMGAHVAILDLLPPTEALQKLPAEFDRKLKYIQTDVSNEDSLRKGFAEGVEYLGRIDGCVTAAGINLDKSFTSHTWAETAKMHTINILGTFFTAQLTTAQLLSQNTPGSILLIGSVKAHCAAPGHHLSGYSASKGAIRSLNTDLAVELAPHGIRVNTISPGYIQTPMNARLQESNPQLAKIMHIASPLQRMGTRNDLTGAAVYLLSEASAYTTGADLVVDGGLSCGRIEGLAV